MREAPGDAAVPAPLARRLLSLSYDALLLAAVLWLAAVPLALVGSVLAVEHARAVYQAYLALVAGLYFVRQWTRGGQTLAMKTWRVKLERRDGGQLTLRQAALRYAIALAGLVAFGCGFLWALFDREKLFLHDRVAKTRIIDLRYCGKQ